MARLPSKGRKKIQLKKIEDERGRAVTLSKRHSGLFKKAGELATLCGAYIAIIVFTIGGKPLSFGSPSFQYVLQKFDKPNQVVNQHPNALEKLTTNSYHASKLQLFNEKFIEVNQHLMNNRKRAQIVDEGVIKFLSGKLYEQYTSNMGIEELTQLKDKLEGFKRHLERNCVTEGGPSSSKDEYQVDLSKIDGPKDYLKL